MMGYDFLQQGGHDMVTVTITLDPAVASFYHQVAQQASVPLAQVLSDALFKLAGELSLEALRKN